MVYSDRPTDFGSRTSCVNGPLTVLIAPPPTDTAKYKRLPDWAKTKLNVVKSINLYHYSEVDNITL